MNYFSSQSNQLCTEDVPMTAIAEQYGSPVYVYSRAALTEHFCAYQNALADQSHLICYAVKANSNLAVLNVLAELGAGFDIVSLGELERVIAAGGDPAKVVFSGVGKLPHEMARALDVGIHCFNVESEPELDILSQIAVEKNVTANVSIRVNPDVNANTHPYISTGLKENKFGIDIDRAAEVYRQAVAMPGLQVTGIDCHIGSQLTEVAPFLDALDRVLLLIETLHSEGILLEHIDLGGGLGVTYQDEQPPHPGEYISALLERLNQHPVGQKLTLVLEPGRSIAANAGVLLTKVIYLKKTEHRNFAVVDAAMNDMIRPALYQAWLSIDPVVTTDQPSDVYDIVGPVCETGDFLGKERNLAIQQGDLLCIGSSGAYGFTMSSNYNSRGRAAEVMVDGENHHLVRRRETVEELFASESLLPAKQ